MATLVYNLYKMCTCNKIFLITVSVGNYGAQFKNKIKILKQNKTGWSSWVLVESMLIRKCFISESFSLPLLVYVIEV